MIALVALESRFASGDSEIFGFMGARAADIKLDRRGRGAARASLARRGTAQAQGVHALSRHEGLAWSVGDAERRRGGCGVATRRVDDGSPSVASRESRIHANLSLTEGHLAPKVAAWRSTPSSSRS